MWLIVLAYLWFTLFGWTRLLTSILNWYWLNFAGVSPGPLYLAVTGVLWGVAGLVALAWLWLYLPRYRLVGAGAAVFFAVTYWADRLLVMNAVEGPDNTTFLAVATFLGLVLVFLALRPWEDLPAIAHQLGAPSRE